MTLMIRNTMLIAIGSILLTGALLLFSKTSPADESSPALTITPPGGSSVSAGETVTLRVLPRKDVIVRSFGFLSEVASGEIREPPFEAPIQIPPNFVGELRIKVFAHTSKGALSDELNLEVLPPALSVLETIVFEPSKLTIPRILLGSDRIALLADFSDGVRRDVSATSETIYSSSNANIADIEIKNRLAFVRAHAVGTVVITGAYRGKSTTLFVRVAGTIAGDANQDCMVDYKDLRNIKEVLGITLYDPRYIGRLDADQDGVISEADVTAVQALLGTKCP